MNMSNTPEYNVLRKIRQLRESREVPEAPKIVWYESKLEEIPGYWNKYVVEEWKPDASATKACVAEPIDLQKLLKYKIDNEAGLRDFEVLKEEDIDVDWKDKQGTAVKVYLPGGVVEYRAYYAEGFEMNAPVEKQDNPSVNTETSKKCETCGGKGKNDRGFPCNCCGGLGSIQKIDCGK